MIYACYRNLIVKTKNKILWMTGTHGTHANEYGSLGLVSKLYILSSQVHRKGSTRAFPPHHPLIPVDYQLTGQPVLIGGTMGSCSYVLTGTERGMDQTFG